MVKKNKNHKIILKYFIAFLKENNAYELYIKNLCKKEGKNNAHLFIINAFSEHKLYKGRNLISEAFEWEKTREGWGMWWRLSQQWIKKAVKLNELYENDMLITW